MEELKPIFPKIHIVEEVSLLRIFQLHDATKNGGAFAASGGVAEVFRQAGLGRGGVKGWQIRTGTRTTLFFDFFELFFCMANQVV